jgi:hypothetical protein
MDELLLLNKTTNISGVIVIPQGPQFQAKGGTFAAFIFIGCLTFFIALLIKGSLLGSFIFLFLAIILFFYFIDVRGIEFNSEKQLVRQYKSFLWFKFGYWNDISNYKSIHLVHANYKVMDSSFFINGDPSTSHFYKIFLENVEDSRSIFLAEYKNYHHAERICKKLSHATGLELRIF